MDHEATIASTGEEFFLDGWRIEPRRNLLTRGETAVRLRPKVMDVLAFLASRPGEVVDNETILEEVWGKKYLARSALSGAVCELRQALGDDDDPPRVIETIPKRGYRLAVTVERTAVAENVGGVLPVPAIRLRFRPAPIVAAAVIVTALGGIALFGMHRDRAPASAIRLAILPFENLGDRGDPVLASGLTGELTTRLASVSGWLVIAHDSAADYARGDTPLATIGEELDVDYVLEGTLQWVTGGDQPDRLRVATRLVRPSDGAVMWGSTLDDTSHDLLHVQADLCRHVAERLRATLGTGPQHQLPPPGTTSPEAYEWFLRGRHHQRATDTGDLLLAIRAFDRSVAFDASFARAHAALAWTHARLSMNGQDRSGEHRRLARAVLAKAEAIDPDAPEVTVTRAFLAFALDHDPERALAELESAPTTRHPLTLSLHLRGYALLSLGRYVEAIAALEEAASRNPRDAATHSHLATAALFAGADEVALAHARRAVELEPDSPTEYAPLASAVLLSTRSPRAALAVLDEIPPGTSSYLAVQRWLLQLMAGDYEAALTAVSEIPENGMYTTAGWFPRALLEAEALTLLNRTHDAEAAYRRANALLAAALGKHPDDPGLCSSKAVTLVHLGLVDEALGEARRAIALCPISTDALRGAVYVQTLAGINMASEDLTRTIATLTELLASPAHNYMLRLIALDPRWAPVHDLPEFRDLLERSDALARSVRPVRSSSLPPILARWPSS